MAGEALFWQMGVNARQTKLPGAAGLACAFDYSVTGRKLVARLLNAGDMVLQARQQGFGVQLFLRLALENGGLTGSGQAATSHTLEG